MSERVSEGVSEGVCVCVWVGEVDLWVGVWMDALCG